MAYRSRTNGELSAPDGTLQVFAGSKQKELEVGSMALMAGYTPIATILLSILVPIFEPIGFFERSEETLFGFQYTPQVRNCLHFSLVRFVFLTVSSNICPVSQTPS